MCPFIAITHHGLLEMFLGKSLQHVPSDVLRRETDSKGLVCWLLLSMGRQDHQEMLAGWKTGNDVSIANSVCEL